MLCWRPAPSSSSARNRRRADISTGTPPAGPRHRVAGSTHASRGKSLSNQRWPGHCRESGELDIARSPAAINTDRPRIKSLMDETQTLSNPQPLKRTVRRLFVSIAAATGLLAFLICATLATSRNWFHDGADTVVARWLSMPWEWSFFVAASSNAKGWGCLGIVFLLPLLVYTAGFFIVLSIIATFRTPRLQSTGP